MVDTPRKPPESEGQLRQIAGEIMRFFSGVDPLYAEVSGGPLRIGGAWRQDLLERRVKQLRAIAARDIPAYAALLQDTFRNELIGGLWSHGYFDDRSARLVNAPDFLSELTTFEYLSERNASDLPQQSSFGNPWGLELQTGIVKFTDPSHGLQADAVIRLLKAFAGTSDAVTVVDLGSGYGGTATKIARWFGRPLRLVLVDIPLNLTTAFAFLSTEHPKESVRLLGTKEDVRAALSQPQRTNIEFILLPSLFVEELAGRRIDVLLNAGSLSEMDFETIRFYLEQLCGAQTKCFIEMNSNSAILNYGGHVEVPSSTFPVPATHTLVSRAATFPNTRFIQSVYLNREFARAAK